MSGEGERLRAENEALRAALRRTTAQLMVVTDAYLAGGQGDERFPVRSVTYARERQRAVDVYQRLAGGEG